MWEPIVWFENIASNGAFVNLTSEENENVVADADFIENPERSAGIVATYAGSSGGSIAEARLDVPSLREPVNHYLGQVNGTVAPGAPPYPWQDLSDRPLQPGDFQRMEVEVRGADGGIAEDYSVIAFLNWEGAPAIPGAEYRRVHFTGDSAAGTADAWNTIDMTLAEQLANGEYHVIGASVRHPNASVFSLAFEGQVAEPGGFAVPGEHGAIAPFQEPGALGSSWGSFRDEAPPSVRIWADAAAGIPEGHLDLVGPV